MTSRIAVKEWLPWVLVATAVAYCGANLAGFTGSYQSPKPLLGSSECRQAQRDFITEHNSKLVLDRDPERARYEFNRLCE